MQKVEKEVTISQTNAKWLKDKTKANGLKNEGKALRCCINYAAQTAKIDDIIDSKRALQLHKELPKGVQSNFSLATSQAAWIEKWASEKNLEFSVVVALVLEACKAQTNDVVFKIVRCKTNTSLNNKPLKELCKGGQAAQVALNAGQEAKSTGKGCGCSK